jgi:Ca2+-binding EF-hand superfamily protein
MDLTPEELADLKESFEYNDLDHDGKIKLREFMSMLESLEAGMEPDEARMGFQEIDLDNDGGIELDEFIRWWAEPT